VERVNPEFDESPNDTGGGDDSLRPMEALDPDDVRNDGGDEVVDPPEHWAAADHIAEEPERESLDEKLAAEEPEPSVAPADEGGQGEDEAELRPDAQIDQMVTEDHGIDRGQVSGTPEDGDSIFPVVE
jgi:hypothetical protein